MPLFLAASIVLAYLGISIVETGRVAFSVRERALVPFGALTSDALRSGELWRLVTSQFLHVYCVHALLNAAAIVWVGSLLQTQVGETAGTLALLCGGIVGQLVAVALIPDAVATGASQAALSLCAAGALISSRSQDWKLIVVSTAYLTIQAALDLAFVGHLKSPHVASVLAGAGVGVWTVARRGCSPDGSRSS